MEYISRRKNYKARNGLPRLGKLVIALEGLGFGLMYLHPPGQLQGPVNEKYYKREKKVKMKITNSILVSGHSTPDFS